MSDKSQPLLPAPVSGGGNAATATASNTKKTYYSQDVLLIALVLNVTLLVVLGVSAVSDIEDAKRFSFPWTYRLPAQDERANMTKYAEETVQLYTNNNKTDMQHLGWMMDEIFQKARCVLVWHACFPMFLSVC